MGHVQTIEPMLDDHVGCQTTPKILNRIMATILSPGKLSDRSLYVHTDEGAILEIEGSVEVMPLRRFLVPGHRVLIVVSSGDVEISAPRSRSRYLQNEWAGRVVLSENRDRMALVTVKILNQPVTFTSTQVVFLDGSPGPNMGSSEREHRPFGGAPHAAGGMCPSANATLHKPH